MRNYTNGLLAIFSVLLIATPVPALLEPVAADSDEIEPTGQRHDLLVRVQPDLDAHRVSYAASEESVRSVQHALASVVKQALSRGLLTSREVVVTADGQLLLQVRTSDVSRLSELRGVRSLSVVSHDTSKPASDLRRMRQEGDQDD